MPRIPDSSQLGYSVPQTRTPRFQDRSGQIVGDATARLAGTIGQAADVLQDREDKFSYAQAKSALLQADIEARRSLENDQDWSTYEKRYTESMTKAREKAAGLIRGNRDRALFDMDAKLDVERGVGEIRGQAKQREVVWGRSTTDQMLETNRAAALSAKDEPTRTSIVNATKDAILGAVQKGYYREDEGTNLFQSFRDSYAGGYIDTLPYSKQVDVLKKPEGTPAQFLQPDARANLLRQAENSLRIEQDRLKAEKESGLSLMRAELGDEVRDIEAAFRMRIPVTQVPSEARFVALYGERGHAMHEQVQKIADASVDTAKLTQLPTTEVERLVGGYAVTQVEGAANKAEIAGVIQQQARIDLKERADDPAGYLVRHSPTVQSAWQAFSSGGPVDKYISAVRGEQERLQLHGSDLLPDSYADEIATQISTADAQKMTGLIQSEAERWGKAWPEVYGQLAPKLTDIAAVIGSGIPAYAADALASTAGLKTQELAAMVPPGITMKDVRDTVADQFADFSRSFPVDAARTVGAFEDAGVRLTLRYMQQGVGRNDAAAKALSDLAGVYDITEFRGVTYRVPRQYDVASIEDGSTDLLANYSADSGSVIPEPGQSSEVLQSDLTEYIRANGYWMTAPDESGLRLYVDGGPVPSTHGAVQYTWQQLTAKGAEARAKLQKLEQEQRAKEVLQSKQPGLR